jgi:hypothetical protein
MKQLRKKHNRGQHSVPDIEGPAPRARIVENNHEFVSVQE